MSKEEYRAAENLREERRPRSHRSSVATDLHIIDYSEGRKAPGSEKNAPHPEEDFPDFGKLLFSKSKPETLNLKEVRGVDIVRFVLNVHREDQVISSISCEKATVNPGTGGLSLEGHVKIRTPEKEFECNRTSYDLEKKRIRARGGCLVRIQNRAFKARDVETDYLLETLLAKPAGDGFF